SAKIIATSRREWKAERQIRHFSSLFVRIIKIIDSAIKIISNQLSKFLRKFVSNKSRQPACLTDKEYGEEKINR
ncbi:MAG: hypothetical protein RRY33_07610, partial [Alistipes sp.]